MMKPESKIRYPGLEPFRTSQKDLFFGRDKDVVRLHDMVSLHPQVLLYAKSGLGKSSLINAGLIPRLQAECKQRDSTFHILPIRIGTWINAASPSPLEAINAALGPVNPSYLDKIVPQEGSLWWHFKSVASRHSTEPTYFLLFDQFEEIFSHPEESIVAFKHQLADLIYRVVPQHFRSFLEIRQSQNPQILSPEELERLYQPLRVKVLYAIREDRYSDLNRLADLLPDIFHNRLRLAPLSRAQAMEAVVAPARLHGDFQFTQFSYSPEALDHILDYLTGQNQPLETTQLQVICSHIERLGKALVNTEDVPAFEGIFRQFYLDSIAALAPEDRKRAREFIEDYMIIEGQRIAYHRLACLEWVSEQTLDILLTDRHLLRTEHSSTGGVSFELSHDTMVAPILAAKKEREELEAARVAEEERLRAEMATAAEEKRLRAELAREQTARAEARRQLRRTRLALGAAVMALIAAIAAIVFGLKKDAQAKDAEFWSESNERVKNSLWSQRSRVSWNSLTHYSRPHFYDDRFGLAVRESNGSVKFGFVDKLGRTTIPFDFEEALPFYGGAIFTKVKKRLPDSTLAEYLLDTNGSTYRLSHELSNSPNVFDAIEIYDDLTAKTIEGVSQFSHAKILLIENCELEKVPDGIDSLQQLTWLSLRNNTIDEISPELCNLIRLRVLNLGNNDLTTVPPEIAGLKSLVELDLSQNEIRSLPAEIGMLKDLKTINLRANQINSLPPEFENLFSLTSINLSGNSLTSFPSEVARLTSLKSLNLMFNHLTSLPAEIGRLKSLETLSLTRNSLRSLPSEIGMLASLKELYLSYNSLKVLPAEIGKLTSLKYLYLDGNPMSSIPIQLRELPALTHLSISFMDIQILPKEIRELKHLSNLNIRDNPCSDTPWEQKEIIRQMAEWLPDCKVSFGFGFGFLE